MMTAVALGIIVLWMFVIVLVIAVPIVLVMRLLGIKVRSTPATQDLKGDIVRAQYEYDRTLRRRD